VRFRPVIIFFPSAPGTHDRAHAFFPIAFAISKKEDGPTLQRILLAIKDGVRGVDYVIDYAVVDAAGANFNAIHAAFGGGVLIAMCWFHLTQAIARNPKGLSTADLKSVRIFTCSELVHWQVELYCGPGVFVLSWQVTSDIYVMHSTTTLDRFRSTWEVAKKGWLASESIRAKGFVEYFQAEWVDGHAGRWFLGATPPGIVKAAGNMERFNRRIKDEFTLRERLELRALIDNTKSMLGQLFCVSNSIFS
jgi:hypothetical protein